MRQLSKIWSELSEQGYTSDKGNIHSYLPIYEEILTPYRSAENNILELGLFKGDSLRMWELFFSGDVYGVDCSVTPHDGLADLRPMIASNFHNIHILDAENPDEVEKHFKGKKFDVVIEDCGHHVEQQLQIYKVVKPYLNKGATYCIEDVQSIDETRGLFENIDSDKNIEIIDRRHIKQRYDDVIIIITDK